MKNRTDFKDHAWELCRQQNYPGCVGLAEAAMKFGYHLALLDFTKEMETLNKELKTDRVEANKPK